VLLDFYLIRFSQSIEIDVDLEIQFCPIYVIGFPEGASSDSTCGESTWSQCEKLHGTAAEPADRPK